MQLPSINKINMKKYINYFLIRLVFVYAILVALGALDLIPWKRLIYDWKAHLILIAVVAVGSYTGYIFAQYNKLKEKTEALENERKIE